MTEPSGTGGGWPAQGRMPTRATGSGAAWMAERGVPGLESEPAFERDRQPGTDSAKGLGQAHGPVRGGEFGPLTEPGHPDRPSQLGFDRRSQRGRGRVLPVHEEGQVRGR